MKIVCIPAYNEEIKINDVVKKSLPYADKVIVCDDGSTDDTAALAKKAGAVVISHEKNQDMVLQYLRYLIIVGKTMQKLW